MTTHRVRRHAARALTMTVAACAVAAATVLPAAASDQPTRQQLMADCASGAGKCTFNAPRLGEA
ncbi:hypothetical protein [Streptomyces sp. Sge12]|uniref:hypothetical protein n=2 Tax=unclassified Streptomyces TaxID=2593676 RepID=UPI001F3B5884|nr:hypothetical protein [Streptomyces sp. Sge12]